MDAGRTVDDFADVPAASIANAPYVPELVPEKGINHGVGL